MTVKEVQTRIVDGKQIKTIIEKELPPDATSLALYLRNRMPEKYNLEKQTIDLTYVPQHALTIEECRQILKNDPFLNPPNIELVKYEEIADEPEFKSKFFP